jgi:hypothetical protein
MTFALPAQLLSSGFCEPSSTEGTGSQTRLAPAGLRTSTRVAIS